MKILIVSNDPHNTGGVVNYTRPLALKFAELGHKVFYFYSSAWNRKYNWLLMPYLKINKNDFPFECAEIINSTGWAYNYGRPSLDIRARSTEKLFVKYIKRIKPDIMHVHSRLGLPFSIIEIAARNGIKIFNTVHVYGLLCQRRVMMDYEGKLCKGPYDLEKCAKCTGYLSIKKLKFIARMNNLNKDLVQWAVKVKKMFYRRRKDKRPVLNHRKIKEDLKKRLDYAINLMNKHVAMNICVSNDVKKILMNYGVKEEKLLVQHIGSKIAENQKTGEHKLHFPIVIGNIGGVGYYKGLHILLEAIAIIKRDDFILKVFGMRDEEYLREIMKGKEYLPVKFFGKYNYEDLPEILNQIDIMALPSICNDTIPQTIFESLSAGIPVIAPNIGGFPDFIKEGLNGYLFKTGDSQELANKIKGILLDPKKILYLSSNIAKLKTITENAQELISLYAV